MANEWADYVVLAVRYEDVKLRERISLLKIDELLGGKLGMDDIWTKTNVIKKIESGHTIFTIYKGDDGRWKEGAEICVFTIEGEKYLRTDANRIKKDNLGELPEF